MSGTHGLPDGFDRPKHYEIRIDGHLGARWSGRFEGLVITLDRDGTTALSGPVADQAALHGFLKTIRDLGMPLISVSTVEPDPVDPSTFGFGWDVGVDGLSARHQSHEEEEMNTYRMNAVMAGIFYFLGTAVAFMSAVIGGEVLSSINTGNLLVGVDILSLVAAQESGVTGGAFFRLLTMISLVAMTVFLYPLFQKDSPELALGMILFRGALEGTGYLLSAVVVLALVALSREYVAGGPQSAALLSMGNVFYQIEDRLAPIISITFLIGTSCLYFSFYRTRLIPRWLSVWGLIGVVPYMAYALLHYFHLDTGYELYMQMVLMPQELVMAVWLIAKGFAPSAMTALMAKTRVSQVPA